MKSTTKKYNFLIFFFLTGIFFPWMAKAQLSNYYWSQSFNSVSSMLSGAVVAGDGGSSSIYYNPANISELGDNSNLSISAVMFSWRYYKLDNLLGNGIHLSNLAFVVQPKFVTYVFNPPRGKISLGATVFTRIFERTELNYASQQNIDILKNYPGKEQYNAYYDYRNRYDDTWAGFAVAYEVSANFHIGVSAFVSAVSRKYLKDIENTAVNNSGIKVVSAIYNNRFLANYTDYRMIYKIGMTYKTTRWRLGLNITTPSFTLFSDSKKLLHSRNQSDITYKGKRLPDYVIFYSREDDKVISHIKLPLSIALGTIYLFPGNRSRLYFTIEHFFPLAPYLSLEAFPHPKTFTEDFEHRWLSIASGSKSLTNIAVGFRWMKKENLGFMLGFRTDFNYLKNFNYGKYISYNILPNILSNNYHFTGGAEFTFLGQKVISGVELTYSSSKNQKQIANFSNPVEYNTRDYIPLQGPLQNTASIHYISINLYLSASLNFGGGKKSGTGNTKVKK